MTEFAVYDNQTFTGVIRDFTEVPVLPGKPYREFYTVVRVSPPFDNATQVRTGVTVEADYVAKTHTVTQVIRNKTAQELDNDKTVTIDAIDMLSFEVNFDQENRIRALEGKTAITRAQYKTALKNRL